MNAAIAARRLRNQLISHKGLGRPAAVVSWHGAVQAQEYDAAKWGLALRMTDATAVTEIERALDAGHILRTHVMRPTWHFVAADDIRWMLELTGPRVQRVMSSYNRRLGLDANVLARTTAVIERALAGTTLTRQELRAHAARARLPLDNVRLAHAVMHAELEGVICSGPRRGKQHTYTLLAERAPGAVRLSRDEAIATLAGRYFRSHGPATVRDFVWWSGLTTGDAKRGLDMIRARSEEVDGRMYWTIGPAPRGAVRDRPVLLLPIYDEYLIAYRDRDAVPHGPSRTGLATGAFATFQHALVIAGQVAGTWRISRRVSSMRVEVFPARRLTRVEQRALDEAVRRFERFLGVPVQRSVSLPDRKRPMGTTRVGPRT